MGRIDTKEIRIVNILVTIATIVVLIITIVSLQYAIYNLSYNTQELEINPKGYNDNVVILHMDNEEKQLKCDLLTMGISINPENGNVDSEIRLNLSIKDSWIADKLSIQASQYTDKEHHLFEVKPELSLSSFKLSDSMVYAKYTNENNDGFKEIVLAENRELVDTSDVKFKSFRFKEINTDVQHKLVGNSFYNTVLILNEAMAGGKLTKSTIYEDFNNVEYMINRTEPLGQSEHTRFKFNGLGDITFDFGVPTIINYNEQDNLVKITDKFNREILCISSINCDALGYKASEFTETKDKRLFTSIRDTKDNDNKYETIGLIGSNNFYILRCSELYKVELMEQLREQLGIQID